MWVRGKQSERGRWGTWDWLPLEWADLLRIRGAVRSRFREHMRTCVARGEQLTQPVPWIEVPLDFSPNAFVTKCVDDLRRRGGPNVTVDFFNIRHFFQTIETAIGSYESGPQPPYERLANVLSRPPAGWRSP